MFAVRVINKIKAVIVRLYGFYKRIYIKSVGSRFIPAFPLVVLGGENIVIGDNFRSMGINFLYGNGGYISIGDNISINTNVQIGASGGKIVIGNNVLIGPNVVIRAADHGISRDKPIRYQSHIGGEIYIEDDVWIASNAVILKNVRLGKGCVVAAGAVVNKDVEPYSIVGGVPAKKISERS